MNTQAIAPFVMQNLVAVVESGALMTTSIKVAEAFSKQHKNVLRKLETLACSREFTELNFELSEYTDTTGRKLSMWNMTKDGFMFLVMGFTGTKAAAIKEAYINEFNRMAAELADVPPVANELHNCSSQQLAQALCQKALTRRFILNIDPESGAMGGEGESITLWPIPRNAHMVNPADPSHLQRMIDFMDNDEVAELMKLTLSSVARRTAKLTQH